MTLQTDLVHPPAIPGDDSGATSTPIFQTATFAQDLEHPERTPWDYSRSGNPTRDVLEKQLAKLDGAVDALAYGTGIAAVSAILRLVRPGERVVCGEDLYGGTQRLLATYADHLGICVVKVDARDVGAIEAAVDDSTRLIWIETPTNPRLRVADVESIAQVARKKDAWLAVDNSMLSPLLQRPLDLGADLAVQSATKLLGGHGDLTAGVVAVRDASLAKRLRFLQNAEGSALAPFPAWLLLRGLETLDVRLERQLGNVAGILSALNGHPAVTRVHYPEQTHGTSPRGGVVISFETGSVEASRTILETVELFRTTVSFGGVTSSISLPGAMSHAAIPPEERKRQGLAEDLLRISVGIESIDDLLRDLRRALDETRPGVRQNADSRRGIDVVPAG